MPSCSAAAACERKGVVESTIGTVTGQSGTGMNRELTRTGRSSASAARTMCGKRR